MIKTCHKVQVAVVHKASKQYLLLELKEDRGFGWQNVTGSVDEGESILEAARRELIEETGIRDAKITQLKSTFSFHDRWQRDVEEFSFLALSDSKEVKICEEEHMNYKWLNIEEINQSNFKYPSNYEVFNEVKSCLE